jgi:FlaA1/EpsC-like NDP-sugar epimerase
MTIVSTELVAALTGRKASLFSEDLARHTADLRERISAARFLVVGAAGSIGSAFVEQLLAYRPRGLSLVDINENALADLVRELRAGGGFVPDDFHTSVVPMGAAGFLRFLAAEGPFDWILNFAALKHVRTERDVYGLMRMIECNVFALEDLLEGVDGQPTRGVFSVSTDKAVRPGNLMGATKRWMERVLMVDRAPLTCNSARFANVAFSNGSLPLAMLQRITRGQPIGAPSNISRFFISREEGGQLCLLSALLGGPREVFVPRLDQQRDAISFIEVTTRILAAHGKIPLVVQTEVEAKARAAHLSPGSREWPCVFAPADTSGEKATEELLYENETVDRSRFAKIDVEQPAPFSPAPLAAARRAVAAVATRDIWAKADLATAIRTIVPELAHIETGRFLDEKL